MRTNIVIEDAVMQAAMAAGEFKTKREAVEEGLRLLARQEVYRRLLALRGKLQPLEVNTKKAMTKRNLKPTGGVKTKKVALGIKGKSILERRPA